MRDCGLSPGCLKGCQLPLTEEEGNTTVLWELFPLQVLSEGQVMSLLLNSGRGEKEGQTAAALNPWAAELCTSKASGQTLAIW